MTRNEARQVIAALAAWEPVGMSVALLPADRQYLRHDAAMAAAPALGLDPEDAINMVDASRMAG